MHFLYLFVTFQNFANVHVFFMSFQLNQPDLLIPNNYCFHNQVNPPPDRLGVVNQTFTKLDMVYCDFIQDNMITTKHGFSLNSWFNKNMVTNKFTSTLESCIDV